MRALLTAALFLAACDGPQVYDLPDTDADTSDVDTDVTADTEADSEVDTEADTEPPPEPIRFVAIGDAGDNPVHQTAVAAAVEQTCATRGCQFALYLGDNFYDTGLEAYDDTRWQTNFELPYANLDFPFYAVLGNHDLGGGGLGLDFDLEKAQYQVDYTQVSDKWTMPSTYYTIPGPSGSSSTELTIFGLDTTRMFFGNVLGNLSTQEDWLRSELVNSDSYWRIGFGHHPYVSNGQHGNAGAYEGITDIVPFSEIPRGQHVKDLFDDVGCGAFDVYFAGHDHNRQILPEPEGCDTFFVVSGAGAKYTDFHESALRPHNDVLFEDDGERGFVWVELQGDVMTLYVVDEDGDEHGPYLHYR